MKVRIYRLMERETPVMEGTSEEIRVFLGMPSMSVGDYWKRKRLIKGKYRLELVEVIEVKREKKPKTEVVNSIPKSMWQEWEQVCSRFRGK